MAFLSVVENAWIYTSLVDTGELSIPLVKSGELQSGKFPLKHRDVVTSHCQSPGGLELTGELLSETGPGLPGKPTPMRDASMNPLAHNATLLDKGTEASLGS